MKITNKAKRDISVIILTVIAVFVVLVVWAGTDSEPVTYNNDEYRDAFMGGCNEGGLYTEYCSCAFNYLDSRMTRDELLDFSEEYTSGVYKPLVDEATDFCVNMME
jgi:hypothetical protein